jgi:hypothetical protein
LIPEKRNRKLQREEAEAKSRRIFMIVYCFCGYVGQLCKIENIYKYILYQISRDNIDNIYLRDDILFIDI